MFRSAILFLTFFSIIILGEASIELTDIDVELADKAGNDAVKFFKQLEHNLLEKGLTARRGSTAFKHGQMITKPSSRIKNEVSLMRTVRNIATLKYLQEKFNLNLEDTRILLQAMKSKAAKVGCPAPIQCSAPSKYRSIDGSCNHLANPHWGEQSTLFNRLLPPAYSNGISTPRRAANGGELPSPRLVSTTVVGAEDRELNDITLVLMSWGQFVTHDITLALGFTYEDGQVPACCANNGTHLPPTDLHPFCLPIDIPADDDYLAQFNQECMTFVRSLQADGADCSLSHAEQVNGNTHFLDSSIVYGSDDTSAISLRAVGQNGLLKTSSSTTGQELLPVELGCANTACFYAGDSRATENPQLTVLHTMFVREHNRLARALKLLNPLWTDEIIYQEARRIVVATVQHITYTEFLPAFLGDQAMTEYGLNPAPVGSFGSYSPIVNPGVTNEFAAAGFRVGHSLVQGLLQLYTAAGVEDQDKSFTLSDFFFDASRLTQPGFIDSALRGLTKQPSQIIDSQYTDELTDRLFKNDKPFGLDLVALNIQRGREHGIPDFNTIRSYCGLQKAQNFEELRRWMDSEDVDNLMAVYNDVNDMDMYIAGLVERPTSSDALIGPTALCLIADQFVKTKNGDRFFYDVGNQPSSFTLEQLDQIRKTSLARIFCDNSDGTIDMIQPRAFHFPQGANARVLCSSIPSVDLSPWKN